MNNTNIYVIPDNFLDESRILGGMFKTKNFIEGVLLFAVSAFLISLIPGLTGYTKIVTIISVSSPLLCLGIIGINGDTLFFFLKTAAYWRQNKKIMLYNGHVKEIYIDAPTKKKSKRQKNKQSALEDEPLVEGVNFVFLEESSKGKQKKVVKPKENQKPLEETPTLKLDISDIELFGWEK